MGKKLSKAPVYYAVAQVQFNPILDLASYVPTIQAKMREAQFPDYRSEVIQRLVMPFVGADGQPPVAPSLSSSPRYIFGDVIGRTSFVLEPNSIGFQTTAYNTFKTFSESFMTGLHILHEVLQLNFVERIGIRYLDAVFPLKDGEELRQYLVPEVLGHSSRAGASLQHSISETASQTTAGQLFSRIIIRTGQVGLPPELASTAQQIDPRFTQYEGIYAVIDTDAFLQQRMTFDITRMEQQLSALHDEITRAFEATVTQYALDAWA